MQLVNGKLTAYNYDWFFETGAMEKVASYADAIGPWYPMLITKESKMDDIQLSIMTVEAKKAGLTIHPFTFRKDKGQIPKYAKDFNDFLDIFYYQVGVDGIFTDFPDLAVDFLSHK